MVEEIKLLEHYIQEKYDADERLRKSDRSTDPYSSINTTINMLEYIILVMAKEIDKLRIKIK